MAAAAWHTQACALDPSWTIFSPEMHRDRCGLRVQAKERDAVKAGKKPFFLKKSDKRRAELVAKYEELKSTGAAAHAAHTGLACKCCPTQQCTLLWAEEVPVTYHTEEATIWWHAPPQMC